MRHLVISVEGMSKPGRDLNPVYLEYTAEVGSTVVILRDKPSGRTETGLTSKD
jgi:hypothetical protein